MSFDTHPVFGIAYLNVSDFRDSADFFGLAPAVLNMGDPALLAALAGSSRAVDVFCSRKFDPTRTITENHKWDFRNKRVFPNSPPIVSLTSYKIRTGANYVATYAVSP